MDSNPGPLGEKVKALSPELRLQLAGGTFLYEKENSLFLQGSGGTDVVDFDTVGEFSEAIFPHF